MASIFPFLQPQAYAEQAQETELYTDVKWDCVNGKPICAHGEPIVVTGLPAVMSWAWRAIYMERFLHEAYSWDYGNESHTMIGQQWLPEVKIAEAERYTKECLLQNPYITAVRDISVSFDGGVIYIKATLDTVYGSDVLDMQAREMLSIPPDGSDAMLTNVAYLTYDFDPRTGMLSVLHDDSVVISV